MYQGKANTTILALLGSLTLAAMALAGPEAPTSGVGKGAALPAYNPSHVTGPDKGTSTCPVCKYPRNPAVQVWINNDDEKNVVALASELEKIAKANASAKFKAFVVYLNPDRESADRISARLQNLGNKLKLEQVSLVYLPGPDHPAVKGYGINVDPSVRNTVFVYKERTVESKFVNLKADEKGLAALREAVAKVI